MASNVDWSALAGLPMAFPVEANYDAVYHRNWFRQNWFVSVLVSLSYVAIVFIGSNLMKSRKAFDLRGPLIAWSSCLSLFSLYGCVRMLPELFSVLLNSGLQGSICDNSYIKDVRVEFAIFLFCWSKVLELVDTLFIVLRKQRLIFLHWYHHFATLIYAFYSFDESPAPFRWFAAMNYAVHTAMYAYYAARAARIRVPRPIAMAITSGQIFQMIAGVLISFHGLHLKTMGVECAASKRALLFGLVLYSSFLVLFTNFFVSAYLCRGSKRMDDERSLNTSRDRIHIKSA